MRNLVGDRVRPLLIIGVTMAIMQQLIGINTVIYYGSTILGFAGLSISSSIAQAVFIGLVNFVFAIVAVFLLDRVGRRAAAADRHGRLGDRSDRARLVLRHGDASSSTRTRGSRWRR